MRFDLIRRKQQKSSECLNCGQHLQDENFCPNCGQINDESKPSFLELMGDFFANLFAFDSKFYRTLRPLLFKPGLVSLEFIRGRRMYYASPVRMFLWMTFIMLFVGAFRDTTYNDPGDDIFKVTIDDQQVDTVIPVDSLTDAMFNTPYNDFPQEPGNESLLRKVSRMYNLIRAKGSLKTEQALSMLRLENTFFNRFLYENARKTQNLNTEEFMRYWRSKLVIILLIFIPFVALILKVLYIRSKVHYYIDHFTFSVHQLTVFFIAVILVDLWLLLTHVPGVGLLFYLAFLVHIWFAMKRFYGQGFWKTLIKLLLLSAGFVVVAFIFLFLSGIITFLLI